MVKKSEDSVPNEQLKRARELHNWTQAQVEEKLQVTQGLVSSWERGTKHPSADNRKKLCQLYKATAVELGLLEERLPPQRVKRLLHPQEQPFPPIWNVPYEPNPMFTGRDQLLDQLHTSLLAKETTVLTQVLSGLGGVGKTQLAVEYCHRYRSSYKGVLWIHAETPDTVLQSLTSIAQLLKWPRKMTRDNQALRKALKEWMRTWTYWLLVLDNVEDIRTVSDLLPPARRGHVIITTRSQIAGKYPKIEVPDLPIEDGALLILRKAHMVASDASIDQAEESDRETARHIAHLLGGLPLALDQAGAYIEETGCSLPRYVERYQTQRALLLHRRGVMAEADIHPESVAVTFMLSLEKIEDANPAAADLLRLCSFLDPDAIPEDFFQHCSPASPPTLQSLLATPGHFEEAIVLIRRYSLIQLLARGRAFSIHRVVQAVIQDDLEERGQRIAWEAYTVAAVTHVFARATTESIFTDYEPSIPHALAVAALLHQRTIVNERAGHLLFLLGHYLMGHARYAQAETLFLDALWLYEQLVGPVHHEIGVQLNNLALVYEEKREHTKAHLLFERALALALRTHPPRPLEIATASSNLARCLWFQGKYREAEKWAQQALALFEQAAAPASQNFAALLVLLGSILRDQGKHLQATALYRRAQHMYEGIVAPDHPSFGYCFEAQATNDLMQGKKEQAEFLYHKALAILEARWGKDHPDVASCLCGLADTCLVFERFEQAEELNRRAWAIYEATGGPEYLEINQPLQGLAIQYAKQEKYVEAEQLCQQAIAIIEKSQGPEHSDLVSALNLSAKLHLLKGDFQEAKQLSDRADALEQKLLGKPSRQES